MRPIAVFAAAASASLALVGCGGKDNGGTPSAATSSVSTVPGEVVLQGIAFNPGTVTVHPGDTVTWRFDDGGVPHSVTSDDGSSATFDSGQQTTGSFQFRFPNPGRYAYHCTVHARMHGTVVVD